MNESIVRFAMQNFCHIFLRKSLKDKKFVMRKLHDYAQYMVSARAQGTPDKTMANRKGEKPSIKAPSDW